MVLNLWYEKTVGTRGLSSWFAKSSLRSVSLDFTDAKVYAKLKNPVMCTSRKKVKSPWCREIKQIERNSHPLLSKLKLLALLDVVLGESESTGHDR